MKPRESSDEAAEGETPRDAGGESGQLATAAQVPPLLSGSSESGVVPSPASDRRGAALTREDLAAELYGVARAPQHGGAGFEAMGSGDEEESTFVEMPVRPLSHEQQVALSRRIRNAMEQTLPLGTPTPGPAAAAIPPSQRSGERGLNAYNTYKQTILLGGRQSPFAGASPPEPVAPAPVSTRVEPSELNLPTPLVPVPMPSAELPSAEMAEGLALRASFVRPVGLPTAPPPRRSRRPSAPDGMGVEAEPPSEEEHEAFKLDRPIGSSMIPPEPAVVEPPPWKWPEPRASSEPALRAPLRNGYQPPLRAPGSSPAADLRSVMLPPRPGPGDFDPPSSPVAAQGAAAESWRPSLGRRSAPQPLLTDLPSVNPFAGFEAPSESFAQRSLIVFIVALAVVGLFALAAVAFGFLGKTGW